MKVAIVIPPWLHPTSPPLGPACLCAYIRQEAKQADAKVFDLNLRHYYLAMELMDEGGIGISIYGWDKMETARRVRHAFDFLKTTPLSSANTRSWHEQATVFLSFENIFNAFMTEMAARSLAGLQVPKAMENYMLRLAEPLCNYRPRLCALSLAFDAQMPMGLALAKTVKERTGAFVCLGGARFGTSTEPHRLFTSGITFQAQGRTTHMKDVRFVDAIVPGEGELAICHLIEALEKGVASQVPGVILKKDSGFIPAGPVEAVKMNSLPCPDFSDLSLHGYMSPSPVLPIMTSRGCAWRRCSFCTHHRSYLRYRQMKIERVQSQIETLIERYSVGHLNIFDEMIPPGRFRRLSEKILASGITLTYSAYVKPVRAFDSDLLGKIRDSGCRLLLWGVESGSQKVLDLMDKGTKVEDAQRILNTAAGLGIRNLVFIMFGFPGETEEDFEKTLAFLRRNRSAIHAISKGLFILSDGCRIQQEPGRFHVKDLRPVASSWGGALSYRFETELGMNPDEAARLYKQSLPRLEKIGISPRLGVYRDHLLF